MPEKALTTKCEVWWPKFRGQRQCQHVCQGVCEVCGPALRAAPRVTHAHLRGPNFHVAVDSFASLTSNMSKPLRVKGSSASAHVVAKVGNR